MNLHQFILYAGVLAAVVSTIAAKRRKEKIELSELLALVTLIGGFLFSVIWEGNSRHILAYPFLLLPLLGRVEIHLKLPKKLSK